MPAKGTRAKKKETRLEFVRLLVLEKGWPRWKVYKAVRDTFEVTDRTIRRDLEDLGKLFRAVLDDPDWLEGQIIGSVERLKKIAIEAYDKGDYKSAIAAEREIVRIHGARSDRWAALHAKGGASVAVAVTATAKGGKVSVAMQKRAEELSALSPEERAKIHAKLRSRFEVINGGERGQAPPEAAGGRTA